MNLIKTSDGKEFAPQDVKLVGSVAKLRDRNVNKPARIGEFPVFVEQSGDFRLFTYNRKLTEI